MKLKKLFNDLRRCRHMKGEYRVKPTIRFYINTRSYFFAFLPTIIYEPWIYRHPNSDGVIDIWWLNCHILIGTFEPK